MLAHAVQNVFLQVIRHRCTFRTLISVPKKHATGEFGIIFDAGGSGTRMYVYEYDPEENPKQTKYIKCEGEFNFRFTYQFRQV